MRATDSAGIRHSGAVVALAMSPDGTMLACGGRASVTVWEIATGTLRIRLDGVEGEVQSLVFSLDSTTLAAATVWGGIWMWEMQSGALVNHKPPTKSRRTRMLFFPVRRTPHSLPKMRSTSLFKSSPYAVSPDGSLSAEGSVRIRVTRYKSDVVVAQLHLDRYDMGHYAVRYLLWGADSRTLALCGNQWVGVWFPFEQKFLAVTLPFADFVYDIALRASPLQVICAIGTSTPVFVDIPAQPLLTRWEAFMQRADAITAPLTGKRDWNWNVTSWGYDGVALEQDSLLWYRHAHNTLDGGVGAISQPFGQFLEEGTDQQVPDTVLAEVYRAVKSLVVR